MRAFVLFLAAVPFAALATCAMLAGLRTTRPGRTPPARERFMWAHHCAQDGSIWVGAGEPCNWCGATEE